LNFIIKIDIEKRKLEKIYPKPRSISEIEKISRYLDDLISINTNKYSVDYEIFQIFSSLNEVYDKKLKYKINKKEDEKLILAELNKISDQNLQSLEKLPYYSELIFNNLGPFTMFNMYNLDLLTENVFKNIYQKLQNDYNLNSIVNENFLIFIYSFYKNFWNSIKIEKINFSEDFLRSINIECFKEFKIVLVKYLK